MKSDQAQVKKLIECTIVQLCQQGLRFNVELKIQGLVVVTVDKQEMFVAQVDFAEGLKCNDDDVEVLPMVDLTEQEGQKRLPSTPRTPSTPRSCGAVNGNKTPKNLFSHHPSPRLYSSPQQFPSPRSSAGGLQRTPTSAARSRLAVDRPPRPVPSAVMVIEDERDDVVIVTSQSQSAIPRKSDIPCRRLSQPVDNNDVIITERSDNHFNNDDVATDKWPSHHPNNELAIAEGKSLQSHSGHLNISDVMIEKRACRSFSCRSNNDEVIVTESWPSGSYESIGNRGTVAEKTPAKCHSDHFGNASAIVADKKAAQTSSGHFSRNYPVVASQSSNQCSPKVAPAVSQNLDYISSEKLISFGMNGTTGLSTDCVPVSGVFKNSQADLPGILPTLTTTCLNLSLRPPISSVNADSPRSSMISRNLIMTSSASKTTAVTNALLINSLPACSHSTTVNSQFAHNYTTINCSSKPEKCDLVEKETQNCQEKKIDVNIGKAKRKFSELSGNNDGIVLQQSSVYRDIDHSSRVCTKANASSLPQKDFTTCESKGCAQILDNIKIPFSSDSGQPECNKGTLQYEAAERVEVVPRPKITFIAEPEFEKSLHERFSGGQSTPTIDEVQHPFVYTDIADSNGIDSRLTLMMDADDESTEAGQLFTPFHCKFPGCVGSYVDNAQLANHYSIMHTDSLKLFHSKDPDGVKTESPVVRHIPVRAARSKFTCPSKSCGFAADLFAEVSAHHRQAHSRSISPRVRQQMMWKSRLPNTSPAPKGMPGGGESRIQAPGLEAGDVVSCADVPLCANDADVSQSSKRVMYSCLSLDNRCSWATADWDELLLHMEQLHNCVVESVAAEAILKQEPRE